MAVPDLKKRVEHLERTVDSLRDLPGRTTKVEERLGTVEVQIVELRGEMRSEFSAIRADMVEMREDLGDLHEELGGLRGEVGGLRGEVGGLRGEVGGLRGLPGEVAGLRGEVGGLREDVAGLRGLPGEVAELRGDVGELRVRLQRVERRGEETRIGLLEIVESSSQATQTLINELRAEMRTGFTHVLEVIESSSQATQLMFDEVKTLIRSTTVETHRLIVEGDEGTRREMRVLHEDLVGRIALLAESRRPRRRRRR